MNNSPKELLDFIHENDVKFIRLTFCDMSGRLKNLAIMPDELPRALEYGIPFDASSIYGECSELLLVPDISTLSVLPWRPKSGRVVRFFCSLKNTDGTDYIGDMRTELTSYINQLRLDGYSCEMGTKCEFYLFELDNHGEPTKIPHDNGGYMDVAPLDRCENVRREICLSLEEMGMNPRSSCHKHGPAQNEIDFHESEPVTAADNMVHYKTIAKSVAAQNGLFASFMPKPLADEHGSALSISLSIKKSGENLFHPDLNEMSHDGKCFISGILKHIREITAFLNCTTNSYRRFGIGYAPKYVDWSSERRSKLIRLHNTAGSPGIEIRSADAACNPYITFKLILAAGIEGIRSGDCSLLEKTRNSADENNLQSLPLSLREATEIAGNSDFVRQTLSPEMRKIILGQLEKQLKNYDLARNKDEFEDKTYFKFI